MANPNLKGAGFDKNPQNINRKGRPLSIKNELKKLLEADGRITIQADQVITVHDNGNVTLKLPRKHAMAMKFISMAMNGNNNTTLKALLSLQEMFDGKPKQAVEHDFNRPEKGSVIIAHKPFSGKKKKK